MKKDKAWNWTNGSSQSRAVEELVADGYSWFKMPSAVEQATSEPEKFVERICGRRPSRIEFLDIRPEAGETTYVHSGVEARFHTDSEVAGSPNLQILICKTPAKDGGETRFLDTWALAHEIKRRDQELFEALFEQARILNFVVGLAIRPTFALFQNGLSCTHAPFPAKNDSVGEQFQNWVDQARYSQFRLSEHDVAMTSNLRLLHGRTSFRDKKRHLLRLLVSFDSPIEVAPVSFVRRAEKYLERLTAMTQGESSWLKTRLAIPDADAKNEHLSALRWLACRMYRPGVIDGEQITGFSRESGPELTRYDQAYVVQAMIRAGVQAFSEVPKEDDQLQILHSLFNKLTENQVRSSPKKRRAA